VKEEGGVVAAAVLRVVRMVKLRGHVAERERRGEVINRMKKMLIIIVRLMNEIKESVNNNNNNNVYVKNE
jgi:t-SNARE complex subunit (syntaxin)